MALSIFSKRSCLSFLGLLVEEDGMIRSKAFLAKDSTKQNCQALICTSNSPQARPVAICQQGPGHKNFLLLKMQLAFCHTPEEGVGGMETERKEMLLFRSFQLLRVMKEVILSLGELHTPVQIIMILI